jgi:hypothetical protein
MRFKWVTRSRRPCQACREMNGEIRTLHDWLMTNMPGDRWHSRCRCTLTPVDEVEDAMVGSGPTSPGGGVDNVDDTLGGIGVPMPDTLFPWRPT